MTELMNTSTRSQHFPPNPNEIAGNRRPARPSSAQQRSTTPTRNRPPTNNATNGLNTTAKLEQSLLKYEGERSFSSTTGKHSSAEKSSNKGKDRLYSTWTPLKHDTTNSQLYDERRQLVNKWFDNWTDEQRRIILEDLLVLSKPRQLNYTRNLLSKKFPSYHQDFTRSFPRVLCLYIFSFLDPRSLCRAAQVCWYWKFLTESDQIWMPKCLRFGWTPKYNPSPFETNVWKRLYAYNIQALQTMPVRDTHYLTQNAREEDPLSSRQVSSRLNSTRHGNNQPHFSSTTRSVQNRPPWRANSRYATDAIHFKYADEDGLFESSFVKQRKNTSGNLQNNELDSEFKETNHQERSRGRSSDRNARKRRSQSLSARGPHSVSFLDEQTSSNYFNGNTNNHYSTNNRPPSSVGSHRPADMPRPPSSAQKSKHSSKTSVHDTYNQKLFAVDYNGHEANE